MDEERELYRDIKYYLPDGVCHTTVDATAVEKFFGDRSSGPRDQIHAEQRRNVVGGSFDFRTGS